MNEENQEPVIMISLEVENYMRVRVFSCEFGPAGIVELSADNGVGKTSILTAMRDLLGGAKETPADPIHHGATKAVVTATSNLFVSKLTITKTKRTLDVRPNKEGAAKLKSPQAIHDAVTGMFLDPEEFNQMPRAERLAVLRKLAGVDTTAITTKRDGVYDARALVNRDLKKAQGALANASRHEGAPASEVSVADLSVEIDRRRAVNEANATVRTNLGVAKANRAEAHGKVEKLIAELAAAKAEFDVVQARGIGLTEAVSKLTDEDTDETLAEIRGAEESNRKVRENAEHGRLKTETDRLSVESGELTTRIDNLDAEKRTAITGAKYPIEGIEARDDDAYLDGVPWEQAGDAEQIKASTAMGFAMHPRLKLLLIRNGSLLGVKSKRIVSEMARSVGGHVLMEVVGDSDEVKVVYEERT